MTKFTSTNVFYIIKIVKLDSKEYSFIKKKKQQQLIIISIVFEQWRITPELLVSKIRITNTYCVLTMGSRRPKHFPSTNI